MRPSPAKKAKKKNAQSAFKRVLFAALARLTIGLFHGVYSLSRLNNDMNHGTTMRNHHKGACPLCGGFRR